MAKELAAGSAVHDSGAHFPGDSKPEAGPNGGKSGSGGSGRKE